MLAIQHWCVSGETNTHRKQAIIKFIAFSNRYIQTDVGKKKIEVFLWFPEACIECKAFGQISKDIRALKAENEINESTFISKCSAGG